MEWREFTLTNLRKLAKVEYIKDSGISKLEREMVLGFNYGQMGPNMKECGGRTKLI